MQQKLPNCLDGRKRKLDSVEKKSEFVHQGHQQPQQPQQPQQAQGFKQASQQGTDGLKTQPLNILIHAHRCRRKDLDVMNSGGIVQPVSRFIEYSDLPACSLNIFHILYITACSYFRGCQLLGRSE